MSYTLRIAKRRGDGPRSAFLLVSVLVCLTLAMALWAVRTRTLVLERRVLVSQQLALQSEYLADAAIARAKAQLAADPAFRGETWQLDAEQLGGLGTASVAISIAEQPGESRVYQLKAVATLLARGTQTQRTRDMLFQATSSGEQP
jgi:hypothetical protein